MNSIKTSYWEFLKYLEKKKIDVIFKDSHFQFFGPIVYHFYVEDGCSELYCEFSDYAAVMMFEDTLRDKKISVVEKKR